MQVKLNHWIICATLTLGDLYVSPTIFLLIEVWYGFRPDSPEGDTKYPNFNSIMNIFITKNQGDFFSLFSSI